MRSSPEGEGTQQHPGNRGGPVTRIPHWPACIRTVLCLVFIACLIPSTRADGETGGVEHLVIVWLKDPGNTAHRNRIMSESQVLTGIPGVLSLRTGTMIPSGRPIVDSSFDVALIVSFTDQAAMNAYLTHPLHVKLVEETLQPLVGQIRVYDIVSK